jgi:hypothetical protein
MSMLPEFAARGRHAPFRIESASLPNWEETEQKRTFELSGDELSYRVPALPDGNIQISVWCWLE